MQQGSHQKHIGDVLEEERRGQRQVPRGRVVEKREREGETREVCRPTFKGNVVNVLRRCS